MLRTKRAAHAEQMGSLTASQLRLFLQAHDIKPLSRKADMLVQVNLFLSGSAL